MKVFDLVCGDGHRFEGWFASRAAFDAQCAASQVACPACDSTEVRRAPSAVRLSLGGDVSSAANDRAASAMAATLVDGLRRLVAKTEDVGPRFAEEARRIHYDEAPPRPIRGVATDAERRALDDEGIETLALPLPKRLTGTLQ